MVEYYNRICLPESASRALRYLQCLLVEQTTSIADSRLDLVYSDENGLSEYSHSIMSPAPMKSSTSELMYLDEGTSPVRPDLVGGGHILDIYYTDDILFHYHPLNKKYHSSKEWYQITHCFSCIRSYKFIHLTPNASHTSGILGSLLVGLLGFRFLLRSSIVTIV